MAATSAQAVGAGGGHGLPLPDFESNSYVRQFHFSENTNFTLWVCIVQATCPRPDRRPARNSAIAEKWMVTKEHDSPPLDTICL